MGRPLLRVRALLVALARTAGSAALRRALPMWGALGIVVCIVFLGPNAMRASDLTGAVRGSPWSRLGLVAGWSVLALPGVHALWHTSSAWFTRAMPLPRAWHLMVYCCLVLLLEAPWALLWACGEPPVRALGVVIATATLHTALVSRRGVGLTVLALPALALDRFVVVTTVVALVGLPLALAHAWRHAPERTAHTKRRGSLGGTPVVALARVHLRVLLRRHASVLVRALGLVGVAALGLALRLAQRPGSPSAEVIGTTLALAVLPVAIVTASIARVTALTETALHPLLRTTGAPLGVRLGAAWGLTMIAGGFTGLAIAAVGTRLAAAASGAALLLGVAWGWVADAWVRAGERQAKGGPLRAASMSALCAGAALLLIVWKNGAALVPIVCAAFVAARFTLHRERSLR